LTTNRRSLPEAGVKRSPSWGVGIAYGAALRRRPCLQSRGANGAWTSLTLIATCKMNGVEPFAYLKTTLERLAGGHPHSRLDELLPWRFEGAVGVAG